MGISITIEGPEGAGKTFLSSLTRTLLEETTSFPILATREPGGSELGEDKIRPILRDERFKNMHPFTNVLLYSASRSEVFFMKERPFLEANPRGILLKDRGWLSTLTLQSVDGANMEYIMDVQRPFMSIPDKFAIVDIPVLETVARMKAEYKVAGKREADWRDKVSQENLAKIRDNYLSFIVKNKERCFVLDCFDDPWIKAGQIKLEIYRKFCDQEGEVPIDNNYDETMFLKKFSEEARYVVDNHESYDYTKHAMVKTFDIDELRKEVEDARAELNFPGRDELQAKMHEEWRQLGIEGGSSGIERGK